ncbi:heme peroxidase, partial [Mycena vulgaris]
CVPWYGIRDAILGGIFHGACGDEARASVRLAFHDAGTWILEGLPNGGADGSMLWDAAEVLRGSNSGLQAIVRTLEPLPTQFDVSPGDILHVVSLPQLACPGGPRIKTYSGRPRPSHVAPDGLLPSPNDSVKKLTDRFADMGFTVRDLVALIGAHSTGKQRFVDPSVAGATFDTTVDLWDVAFYQETDLSTTFAGNFKLNSDVNLAHNKTSAREFRRYVGNQGDWNKDYTTAHEKMSLLRQDVTALTDCTEIMPASIDLTPLRSGLVVDPIKLEAALQKYRAPWL